MSKNITVALVFEPEVLENLSDQFEVYCTSCIFQGNKCNLTGKRCWRTDCPLLDKANLPREIQGIHIEFVEKELI